jgi:hypothetical protein
LPLPNRATSKGVPTITRNPPKKAPANRQADRSVRSTGLGVMTPINAE